MTRPRVTAPTLLVTSLLALPACVVGTVTQEKGDDGEELCAGDENRPPAPPTVLSPDPGRIDVLPDELAIRVSDFSDPDPDDTHVATQLEIWRLAGGEPVLRVWTAHLDPGAGEARLADGTFEVGETLEAWADYAIVARHRDSGDCSAWSEWSDPRAFRTDDGSFYWFGDSSIREVRISLSQESWDAINAQAVPPGCVPYIRQYYPGTVTVDGVTYDGAGVRTKGGCGSARNLGGKASWKINLSWDDPNVAGCPDTRRSHGLKRLTLNNQVQDRSFVHERLAYRFYQLMGVPTPRANHVRVYVNDEFWGLYLHLESIDRRMLSRWFGSNQGMLYEATYWCDLVPENVPPPEMDASAEDSADWCISRKFRPNECEPADPTGDPETFAPIREMTAALASLPEGGFYPEIDQIFDFDTFLSLWAVENVIGHWDGYSIRIVNNYRVYRDPSTGKWTIIPTGLDQSFVENTPINEVAGQLAVRCWAEEDCQAAFRARLAQAVDVFEQANLGAVAAEIRDTIAPHVQEDPRKEGSYDEFQGGVSATISFIENRPGSVRAALGQ